MAKTDPVIRTIMAPIPGRWLLLPNNVVTEVLGYQSLVQYEHGPAWLMGEMEWNSWQVPVISFAELTNITRRDPASSSSRILVVKSLSEDVSLYYIGILINGLPKLNSLKESALEACENTLDSPVIFKEVKVGDKEAIIPDLKALAQTVSAAVYDH